MDRLRKLVRKVMPFAFLDPQGSEGIAKIGHRAYVGGMWDEIGQLQFDFLVAQGMQPHHVLIDVACGALRLGVKAIPYLEPGHYLGIEKEAELVQAGLEVELPARVREERQPRIVVSDSFEFERLGMQADYAIAQSLFSHLPPGLIETCFARIAPALREGACFYATYFLSATRRRNPAQPHDHGYFAYTVDEMQAFGGGLFDVRYIGDWNHPRDQVMVEYRKRAVGL